MDDLTPAGLGRSVVATLRDGVRFAGRARRTEVGAYWGAALAVRLTGWPLLELSLPRALAVPVERVLGIAFVLPGVALFARRMHDRNLTGWLALLLVAVAGWAMWPRDEAALRMLRDHPGADWTALLPAVLSAAIVVLHLLPGTDGANRFGPDPRARRDAGTLPPPGRFRRATQEHGDDAMPTDAEIEARFWKDLKASPFMMLGVEGARDGQTQPMTAQFDEDHGPIWFFTTKDNGLVTALSESNRAIATFTGKSHDLFASVHGSLAVDNDRATVDRLWNPHVEAWFEGGKDDPRLCLLRLDTERAKLWLGGSSIGAMIERLSGKDPKDSYKDNMAEVSL